MGGIMRILVVGAGAIGGYFGGRLLEKGEDVTFLVREGRKKQLEQNGLRIDSVYGNSILSPKTIMAGDTAHPFDVVLLTTKSYHLQGAIEDISQYIGAETVIIPLLNGISHIEQLIAEFGKEKIVGGMCFIESTLDQHGSVVQTSAIHDLVFGELSGEKTERILKIADAFSGTKASFQLSENINQDMWHKYLFIAAMSGITSLMRAPIGPIRKTDSGRKTIGLLISELTNIMNKLEAPMLGNIEVVQMNKIDELGYGMKSSMQRDMEKSLPIEVEHLHGFLLDKANGLQLNVPILEAIYANLKVYEQELS
jgi:2-dehydropantoate 2-reductase